MLVRKDALYVGLKPTGPERFVSLCIFAWRLADIPRKKLLFPYSMAMASKCIAEHVRRILGKISRRGS